MDTHYSLSTEGTYLLAASSRRMCVDIPVSLADMPLDEATSLRLRALAEEAAKEQDPKKLRELILAVNSLLDVLERQVAKLKEPPNHSIN